MGSSEPSRLAPEAPGTASGRAGSLGLRRRRGRDSYRKLSGQMSLGTWNLALALALALAPLCLSLTLLVWRRKSVNSTCSFQPEDVGLWVLCGVSPRTESSVFQKVRGGRAQEVYWAVGWSDASEGH